MLIVTANSEEGDSDVAIAWKADSGDRCGRWARKRACEYLACFGRTRMRVGARHPGCRTSEQSIGKPDILTIVADLGQPQFLQPIIAEEIKAHGPFYGLVNNAAIYPKAKIATVDVAEIASVLNVNAIAAASLVQACLPGMMSSGEGRVINIASNTFDIGMEELSSYVASKGALIGFTRVWARELRSHGITVNAVSPGAFCTDAEKIHPDPEKYNAFVLSKQALKRRAKPVEFAELVTFLLSDHAEFITGQNIRIDGGWITQ